MKELGITKGEWSYKRRFIYRKDWRQLYEYGGGLAGDKPVATVMGTGFYSDEELHANGNLIADAGTTSNKCGMLPSELLERYNEAIDVLEEVHKDGDNYLPRTTRIKVEQTISKSKQ